MLEIKASIARNFELFEDDASDELVVVDSFDNREFAARFGTLEGGSVQIGTVIAFSDAELTDKLIALVAAHRRRQALLEN